MTNEVERPIRRRWLRRRLAGAAALLLVVLLATLYVAPGRRSGAHGITMGGRI